MNMAFRCVCVCYERVRDWITAIGVASWVVDDRGVCYWSFTPAIHATRISPMIIWNHDLLRADRTKEGKRQARSRVTLGRML